MFSSPWVNKNPLLSFFSPFLVFTFQRFRSPGFFAYSSIHRFSGTLGSSGCHYSVVLFRILLFLRIFSLFNTGTLPPSLITLVELTARLVTFSTADSTGSDFCGNTPRKLGSGGQRITSYLPSPAFFSRREQRWWWWKRNTVGALGV